MIVVVAPGQGSQAPGFLTPWLDEERFRDQLSRISDVAELDLIAHGTTSDADAVSRQAAHQRLQRAMHGAVASSDRTRGAP